MAVCLVSSLFTCCPSLTSVPLPPLLAPAVQDAQEFFGHLLEVLSRAEHAAGSRLPGAAAEPTTRLFKFGTEDRIQCTETGRVRLILRCRVFCSLCSLACWIVLAPCRFVVSCFPLRLPGRQLLSNANLGPGVHAGSACARRVDLPSPAYSNGGR